MFTKLLVPIDGSAPSGAAVTLAVEVALDQRAPIVFAHVIELLTEEYVAWEGAAVLPSESEQPVAGQLLERATSAAAQAGVEATSAVLHGDVIEAVLNLAQERGVDLVVMGSHGRSGIARALTGSKTEGLLRRSPVPVLVAAHPSHGRETVPADASVARGQSSSRASTSA